MTANIRPEKSTVFDRMSGRDYFSKMLWLCPRQRNLGIQKPDLKLNGQSIPKSDNLPATKKMTDKENSIDKGKVQQNVSLLGTRFHWSW